MIIYAVIRASTDEIVYIGQTTQRLANRKGKHLSEARKGRGSVLGAAIRKHSINEFKFIQLESCESQKDLCKMEKHLIKKFKPRYNVQEGGKESFTPWNKGKVESRKSVKENMSHSAKSRKRTKRGKYSHEATENIRKAKLKNVSIPFICHQNKKVYNNKVEAAQDLGIKAGGISAALSNKTRNKTHKGYSFSYINPKGD